MKFVLSFLLLVSSALASAQTRIVSVDAFDLSYTGGLLFKNDSGKGPKRRETTFKINLNYAQALPQYVGLMWKAKAYFNREDLKWGQDQLTSTWGAAGGLLYNFNAENIKESFYVGGMLGLERATIDVEDESDKSGFNVYADLEGGKRFSLGQYSVASIAYSPSVSIVLKRYGGGIREEYFRSGNEVRFNFLKFDVLF